MKTSTASNYSQPPISYPPSVPLYVYRELTVELQAVQSKLDVVTSHNQKLAQENQQLRQEITKVIQSCLELQKLVDASVPNDPLTARPDEEIKYKTQYQSKDRNNNEFIHKTKPKVTAAPPRQEPKPQKKAVIKNTHSQNHHQGAAVSGTNINATGSQRVFIEEKKVRFSRPTMSNTKELSGWNLLITIVLIMITGFAAGYVIVRPLFQNHSQQFQLKH
ncbi:MAG: guanine nucleotide-binding protein subunit gamma [Dolichospermum sp.]